MALPFFHLSQMFQPQMSAEDVQEIKFTGSQVQVKCDKTPIRMSKKDVLLRRKTQHIGQQHSKIARRLTDENKNTISVNIFSLR